MIRFILKRLLQAIPVLIAIYTITFFMIRLAPGGPFSDERKIAEHILEQQKEYYGYNDPIITQYFRTLGQHITLDLPPLTSHPGLTAADIITESFPTSLELGLYSIIIALLIGIPAGVLAAAKKNSWLDHIPMSLSMVGICMPTFVIGPLLAIVFGIWLNWTSVSGWEYPRDKALPSLTLGLFYAAYVARLTRGSMLEVINSDFIRTARAKGVSEVRTILVHALRGGIMPVISFLGPTLAGLVTGSFVVESIFQIPGIGRHFILAAVNRDHSLILSTVLLYAALIMLANLLVDILQVALDPKLRQQ
ncbi:ABC transporter permease [Puniceicoccaceae bacterium K14]|nr:ABC transporter permease [Puniceicoccaceae bacterium K14]